MIVCLEGVIYFDIIEVSFGGIGILCNVYVFLYKDMWIELFFFVYCLLLNVIVIYK